MRPHAFRGGTTSANISQVLQAGSTRSTPQRGTWGGRSTASKRGMLRGQSGRVAAADHGLTAISGPHVVVDQPTGPRVMAVSGASYVR